MDEWKITRDRSGCDRPGCPLPSARQYFAVLEFPACVRRDVCDACFCDLERRAEGQAIVYWRAVRKKSDSREPVLDLVSLRALFDRLAGVDDERARQLRYFCALLLLRKRVLKMVRPRTPEQERADLVVADPKAKEQEPFVLFAPAIDLDDLGKIKEELLAMLGEGDGSGSETGAPPEAARAVPVAAAAAEVEEPAVEELAVEEPAVGREAVEGGEAPAEAVTSS